jgi:hypothetical protein
MSIELRLGKVGRNMQGNAAILIIFQDTETLIVIAWLALIIGKYKLEGLFGKYSGR